MVLKTVRSAQVLAVPSGAGTQYESSGPEEAPGRPRHSQHSRNGIFGAGLRCLEAMPSGYCCDCSKTRGFRCDQSISEAILTALSPSHNEFYNVVTDIGPLIFFIYAFVDAVYFDRHTYGAAPAHVQAAFAATSLSTIFQKFSSLVAHTLCGCGPRLSHTIWYLDYCGIALNFVHNATMVALVACGVPTDPQAAAPFWWCWLGLNAAVTVPLLAWTTWLTATVNSYKAAHCSTEIAQKSGCFANLLI